MLNPRLAFKMLITLFAWVSLLAVFPAHADTVYVKYRGPVALDAFSCDYPSSSLVHRICYKASDQYVVVLLSNTYYHYCRVPPAVVQAWLEAASKGQFYNSQIKGRFDCREGGMPQD